jgi:thiamine pyrophosphokinase
MTTLPDSASDDDLCLEELPEAAIAVFDGPVIMVGGGAIDEEKLSTLGTSFSVIAVDSGADHAAAAGLVPDILIGDFDSATSTSLSRASRRIEIKDQNSTDFQKALSAVAAPVIYGFGFLGRRFDHSLAAMHALTQNQDRNIILIDPHDLVVVTSGRYTATLPRGLRLSLWSPHPQRFKTSRGLLWPLDGLEVGVGRILGTSNQVTEAGGGGAGDIEVEIVAETDLPFAVLLAPEAFGHLVQGSIQEGA